MAKLFSKTEIKKKLIIHVGDVGEIEYEHNVLNFIDVRDVDYKYNMLTVIYVGDSVKYLLCSLLNKQ